MGDGSASGAGKGDKMKERVNAKQIFLELIVIVTAVLSIYAVCREEIPRIVGDAFGGFLLVALLVASFGHICRFYRMHCYNCGDGCICEIRELGTER